MKKWKLRPKLKIPEKLEKMRLNPITTQLLLQRNIDTPQKIDGFFGGRYQDLLSPFDLLGIREAVERIGKAKDNGEQITIFGDYDADGLTATALLKEGLEELGFAPTVYIPDRNKEGYGLNKKAIDFIKKEYGSTLIITVDCGISNWEEIEYAREKKIEVIVTDHHSIPKKIPGGSILINPHIPKQKYSFQNLAGVGVAFKLVSALFEKHLPKKIEQLKWFLDLVAIGTVSDCVPLIEENRVITKFGLIVLQKTRRIGLQELANTARLNIGEKNPPSAENIAFQIGPRLNASGRVDHADLTLSLLLAKDTVKARILALEVENKNSQRQKITQQIYNEIKATLDGNKQYRLIIRVGDHWPLGIVGVVAGKICDEYHCPVFLLRRSGELIEGSGRSISAFDIYSAVSKLDTLVEKYGGHAQAMGLKLKPKNLKMFEKKLLAIIDKSYNEGPWEKELLIDAEIEPGVIDWDIFSEVSRFEPFGEGNREPIFLAGGLAVKEIKVVGNGQKHLKMIFSAGNSLPEADQPFAEKILEGIYFKGGERFSEFKVGDNVSAVFFLRSNEWNGSKKLELNIIDMKVEKNGK